MMSEEAEERRIAARLERRYPLSLSSDKPTGVHSKQSILAEVFIGKVCVKCGSEERYLRSRACRVCNIRKARERAQRNE
jgi:hypothetical protein